MGVAKEGGNTASEAPLEPLLALLEGMPLLEEPLLESWETMSFTGEGLLDVDGEVEGRTIPDGGLFEFVKVDSWTAGNGEEPLGLLDNPASVESAVSRDGETADALPVMERAIRAYHWNVVLGNAQRRWCHW